jgi:hypothetical protein
VKKQMRKINLKAKNLSSDKRKRGYSGRTSLFAGIGMLFLAASLYGGVFYLKSKQSKKLAAIEIEIKILKNGLDGNSDYKELYDFQDKLLEIGRIFKGKVIQKDILDQISEVTMNENVLRRLKISMANGKSAVDLTVQTADLSVLAKQLNAYSQIDIDKQALLSGSSLREDGVDASVKFTTNTSRDIVDKNSVNK